MRLDDNTLVFIRELESGETHVQTASDAIATILRNPNKDIKVYEFIAQEFNIMADGTINDPRL
ncbi:MAG: hypothetical protein K0U20_08915 [Proteobacteria bacterium]|nr:hypothetical protein [Pseudomonadota bacterium]